MNAMEKVACTEIVVSTSALVATAALYPWLGDASTAAFAILGFVVVGMVFLRKRGDEVITDERDTAIERESTNMAVRFVWMMTTIVLIALTIVFGVRDSNVPSSYLVWLVWVQFALLYLAKGILSLRAYRGSAHAAQS